MKVTIKDVINPETKTNETSALLECNAKDLAVIMATFVECICRGKQEPADLICLAISLNPDPKNLEEMIAETKCPEEMGKILMEIYRARYLSRR